MYNEKFFRNLGAISKEEQDKIRNSVFVIVGLGGTGGIALETLARMGAENFILFDYDRIELTNFNRQILATDEAIDEKKIETAEKRLKSINQNIKIKKYCEKFESKNGNKIKNCDILIDASDNMETRLTIAGACRKLRIPYVFCSANNNLGMVTLIGKNSKFIFEKMFQVNKKLVCPSGKSLEKQCFSRSLSKSRDLRSRTLDEIEVSSRYAVCRSILAPAAFLAGTIAASQALNCLLKRHTITAPEVLFFDVFAKELFYKKRLE